MNVVLPEKQKLNRKTIIIYIVAVIFCVIAIGIVVGVQVLGDEVVDNFFGVKRLVQRTKEEELELKANFDTIFDNTIEGNSDYIERKIDSNKEIVYTAYEKEEKQDQNEVNVVLPCINIKNTDTEKFNRDVINKFAIKAEDILKNSDTNVIYTVKYKAYVENNILSLILYSYLKQDDSAQRVIIETFNYNLEQNEVISLEDTIKIYELSKTEIENKIKNDIEEEEKRAEDLRELGYDIYSRNLPKDYYNIENIEQFFIYNGNIYIIFAYGNNEFTSEKDIVII